MKTKKMIVLWLVLFVLFVLSSSVSAQVTGKNYVQGVTKDEILIAESDALTGPGAYFGISLVQSAELYFNEVNAKGGIYGRKIRIVREDDGCTAIKGLSAINKLLAEKPFMLYGPGCSGVELAALETVAREGIPQVTAVSTPKSFIPLKRNIFNVGSIPDNLQTKMHVDYDIHNLKVRRIAIIHDASESGTNGKNGIVERLEEYGLKPIAVETYNAGDIDFTAQILKVKDTNPEVVHLYGYAKEAAIIVRQAKELGLSAQFLTYTAITQRAFLESAGDSAIGVLQLYPLPYLVDSPSSHIVDFLTKLKTNYRMTPGRPDWPDLCAYGMAKVIEEGLKRAGKDLTWEKFISALETIRNFETGFIQPVTFSPTVHYGITRGKFLVVLPGKKWQVLAEDVVVREKVEKIQ